MENYTRILKKEIKTWSEKNGLGKFTMRIFFKKGNEIEEINPIVFETDEYDNVNFYAQKDLIQNGYIEINTEKVKKRNKSLEDISYGVFLSIVNNLEGKDLINLCNSSRKLNAYCNKPLTLLNGKVIDQYLFRVLLEKSGIGGNEIEHYQAINPILTPREIYKRKEDILSYNRLTEKLKKLEKEAYVYPPRIFFDLLYNEEENDCGFLQNYFRPQRDNINYLKAEKGLNLLDTIRSDQGIPFFPDLKSIAEKSNQTSIELIKPYYDEFKKIHIYKKISDLKKNMDRVYISKDQVINLSLDELLEIVTNYTEYYHKYLLETAKLLTQNDFEKVKESIDEVDIQFLDDDDIKFLIKLHNKIMKGNLKLSDPLTLESILKSF